MTLRILFTLAILAGLAAAPGAQTFRWEPNRSHASVGDRVERAIERAGDRLERQVARLERSWERAVARLGLSSQAADRIEVRVRTRVDRRVQARVRSDVRANSGAWFGGGGSQLGTNEDPCAESRRRDDDDRQHCEVREESLPAGPLTVDAAPNGGISVEAWDGNGIRVRAIVRANARSDERARELAAGVRVDAGGGRVGATDLDLRSTNGGITIAGVSGQVRFTTTNGGVTLTDLGGHVSGRTTNGGLSVRLSGQQWDGEGLDVETTNGGVTLAIPDGYNAALEARTRNGGLRLDFPVTVQGEIIGRRGIAATLGSGGPPVKVRTNNGGVKIARR